MLTLNEQLKAMAEARARWASAAAVLLRRDQRIVALEAEVAVLKRELVEARQEALSADLWAGVK